MLTPLDLRCMVRYQVGDGKMWSGLGNTQAAESKTQFKKNAHENPPIKN